MCMLSCAGYFVCFISVCVCAFVCRLFDVVLLDFYFGAFFICYVISITHAQLTHVIIQSCGQPLNKIDDLFKACTEHIRSDPESRTATDPLTPTDRRQAPLKLCAVWKMNFVEQLKGHRQAEILHRFRFKCLCLFIGQTHSNTYIHFRAISICDWWTANV